MALKKYHRAMDRAYGSMIIDIYNRFSKTASDDETIKSIINEIMEPFGGKYQRLPKKWITDHCNDPDYDIVPSSYFDKAPVAQAIKIAIEDETAGRKKQAIILFWQMFICYMHIIFNNNPINFSNFNMSKIMGKIYGDYIKNINTDEGSMFESFESKK